MCSNIAQLTFYIKNLSATSSTQKSKHIWIGFTWFNEILQHFFALKLFNSRGEKNPSAPQTQCKRSIIKSEKDVYLSSIESKNGYTSVCSTFQCHEVQSMFD